MKFGDKVKVVKFAENPGAAYEIKMGEIGIFIGDLGFHDSEKYPLGVIFEGSIYPLRFAKEELEIVKE